MSMLLAVFYKFILHTVYSCPFPIIQPPRQSLFICCFKIISIADISQLFSLCIMTAVQYLPYIRRLICNRQRLK